MHWIPLLPPPLGPCFPSYYISLVTLQTTRSLKAEVSSCTSLSSLYQRPWLVHMANAQTLTDGRSRFKTAWSHLTLSSSLYFTTIDQTLPRLPFHSHVIKFFLSVSTILIQALQVISTFQQKPPDYFLLAPIHLAHELICLSLYSHI